MNLASFLVRDACLDDLAAIVSFNAALAAETEAKALDPGVLTRGVRAALADPQRLRYWVAEDAETRQIIGQAAVTSEWSDWRNGQLWWLQSVYVAPQARARGVFRSLFARICESAHESRVIGIRLYVEHANSDAQRTYESLGFAPGGYQVYEHFFALPE
jgi:GNAT superfamily N-acetyltransferase